MLVPKVKWYGGTTRRVSGAAESLSVPDNASRECCASERMTYLCIQSRTPSPQPAKTHVTSELAQKDSLVRGWTQPKKTRLALFDRHFKAGERGGRCKESAVTCQLAVDAGW
eukprot:70048-Rhodomonas_salina.1